VLTSGTGEVVLVDPAMNSNLLRHEAQVCFWRRRARGDADREWQFSTLLGPSAITAHRPRADFRQGQGSTLSRHLALVCAWISRGLPHGRLTWDKSMPPASR